MNYVGGVAESLHGDMQALAYAGTRLSKVNPKALVRLGFDVLSRSSIQIQVRKAEMTVYHGAIA